MYKLISVLLISTTSLFLCSANYPQDHTEAYWSNVIHAEIGGVQEYILEDRTRVDLLLPNRAAEIDFQTKWAEGIGQALYYGKRTNRPPLVILLAKNDNWKRYYDRVQFCGIECWVYDTRTRKWLKK